MELLPDWTTLALQRLGQVPGPQTIDEELTSTELEWLIEGLQLDCFYTPDAEKRLTELSPRFTQIDVSRQEPFSPQFVPTSPIGGDWSSFNGSFGHSLTSDVSNNVNYGTCAVLELIASISLSARTSHESRQCANLSARSTYRCFNWIFRVDSRPNTGLKHLRNRSFHAFFFLGV